MEQLDDLQLGDTSLSVFYVLTKGVRKHEPVFLKDGVDRYINMSFIHTIENWYVDDVGNLDSVFDNHYHDTT